MRMAKSLIAAVLLAAALVGAVVVPAALTRGTFAFDAWPKAPQARTSNEQVAVAEPLSVQRERVPADRSQTAPKPLAVRPAAPAGGSVSPNEVARADTPAATPHSGEPRQQQPASGPAPGTVPTPSGPGAPGDETAQPAPVMSDAPPAEARPVAVDPPVAAEPQIDDPEGDVPDHGVLPPPGWVHPPRPAQAHHGHPEGKN
ncbi:MAG: hypothetical protein QOG63_2489 [Thermoleophilaceae bacterium]|jgi:hypothetical protein|nr:hypothetical protein [Thermoleophilaceae bacterium]